MAEVTSPAAAAGRGQGGMDFVFWWEQDQGAVLVPVGSCQDTGLALSTLVTPCPLPAAAAMNLDRIGEHAEAMFGVG